MAQSADQATVTCVITAQQLELIVDKVENKDRGIELSNLMIAAPNWAEPRYIVERKVGLSEWLRVRALGRGSAPEYSSRRPRVVGTGW